MDTTLVGFNLQWMYDPNLPGQPREPDSRLLDFLAEEGFGFVRFPLNYWFWTRGFEYGEPDERVLELADRYVGEASARGLHVSLNLHRAPGYCINGAELERHNLWKDRAARSAFAETWSRFAIRYRDYPPETLSFDLLNEPPDIGQYGMTRVVHREIMTETIQIIRKISPKRPIILDGLGGGNLSMPEMADSGCIHSTRGYQPMSVTHHAAPWCAETKGLEEEPYPGAVYDGKVWNRDTIRAHYEPWREAERLGVRVHVGEMGCYDTVSNATALAWYEDVLAIFVEFGWGFALWNFEGPFGVAGHRRPGARFEKRKGFEIDTELWDLIVEARDALRAKNRLTPGKFGVR